MLENKAVNQKDWDWKKKTLHLVLFFPLNAPQAIGNVVSFSLIFLHSILKENERVKD